LERAKKKRQKDKEQMEHLANGAPSLVPMSNPPTGTHNSPTDEWKRHMKDTILHIRNVVDSLCVTHNVQAPSFVGTATSMDNAGALQPMRIVGKVAQMFIEQDLVDMETATAHMKTWMPVPWRESFQMYLNSFNEILTSSAIPGASSRHLTTLVDLYMAKKFEPIALSGKFQRVIDSIRDGDLEDLGNDDSDLLEEDSAEEKEPVEEDAVADIEAAIDLNDTTAGAAVLSALRA